MDSKPLSFDHLIAELKNNNKVLEKGKYSFKELTLKQQRKILNGSFDAVEIPAKLATIYGEYISESVQIKDDMVDVARTVTLETKPYFINVLRTLSLGSAYYENGICYELYDVTPEDLVPKAKPHTVTANKFKINLRIPTIYEDNRFNNLLINALSPYKKKKSLNDINIGSVSDLYQMYELVKYIESFEFDGKVYQFNSYTIQDRNKFLNNLAQVTINEIKDYIKEHVKDNEERALTAIGETGEKVVADINTIFFTTTTKKDESEESVEDDE